MHCPLTWDGSDIEKLFCNAVVFSPGNGSNYYWRKPTWLCSSYEFLPCTTDKQIHLQGRKGQIQGIMFLTFVLLDLICNFLQTQIYYISYKCTVTCLLTLRILHYTDPFHNIEICCISKCASRRVVSYIFYRNRTWYLVQTWKFIE
jgi:hypothetical protein